MGIITRPTAGLLDLLGSKGVSTSLNQFADFTQPTVETLRLLIAAETPKTYTDNRAPVAVGYVQPTNLVVPAGRIWIVLGYCVELITQAGDTLGGQCVAWSQENYPLECENVPQSSVGGLNRVIQLPPTGGLRVLIAGQKLGYNITGRVVVTGIGATASATVVELTV